MVLSEMIIFLHYDHVAPVSKSISLYTEGQPPNTGPQKLSTGSPTLITASSQFLTLKSPVAL